VARIAVLAQYYHPAFKAGGPVPGVRNAVKSLSGHAVMVFTSDRDLGDTEPFGEPYVGRAKVDDAEVTYLPGIAPGTAATWLRAARRLRTCDAVYINSLFSFPFSVAPLIYMTLVRFRGTVAIAPRGEMAPSALSLGRSRRKKIWLALLRLLAMDRSIGRKGNVVWLASSPAEQRNIVDAFPYARVYLSPETLRSPSGDRPVSERVRGNELELICIARLAPVKGTIDLFKGLERVGRSIHLRMVGLAEDPRYVEELQAVEARFSDAIRVSWLGSLPADAVTDALRTADFSVLLSRGENFSHAIGESLLAGCPVLISDQTPWSFVGERNAGFVLSSADCRDPDRVAQQIDEIAALTDADWRNMCLAARQCGEAGLVVPGTVTIEEALGFGSA